MLIVVNSMHSSKQFSPIEIKFDKIFTSFKPLHLLKLNELSLVIDSGMVNVTSDEQSLKTDCSIVFNEFERVRSVNDRQLLNA